MLQVLAIPLKQRPTTAVVGMWGGTHACGTASDLGAPCLGGSAYPRLPRGHMCAHACAARRAGVQERHRSEVDVPHVLRLDYFGCAPSCISPRAPVLWVHRCERGAAGMQATVHPFIYSNINIFSFRPQSNRDKALPRGLSIPPRLIRLQTQFSSLGMPLDAFVLPKRA